MNLPDTLPVKIFRKSDVQGHFCCLLKKRNSFLITQQKIISINGDNCKTASPKGQPPWFPLENPQISPAVLHLMDIDDKIVHYIHTTRGLRRSLCVMLSMEPEGRNMDSSWNRISAIILAASPLSASIYIIFDISKQTWTNSLYYFWRYGKRLRLRKPKHPSFFFLLKGKQNWMHLKDCY